MKRYKHSLSNYKLLTTGLGFLTHCGLREVIPGDTFDHSTSMLVRLSPLMAPVMHPVVVRLHHFFVPHRLVWDGWEDFITAGPDGNNVDTVPQIVADGSGFVASRTLDYMGVPPDVPNLSVSALPLRGYNLIYNEFYRDQDLTAPVNPVSNSVHRIAWQKDYFTGARPWSQKGPAITLPIAATATVDGSGNLAVPAHPGQFRTDTGGAGSTQTLSRDSGTPAFVRSSLSTSGPVESWIPTYNIPNEDIAAGLTVDLSGATAVGVNDVRRAFALQRYAEARARYGSRYTEYLAYLGVNAQDARLQRPEYLGGGKQTISFSEVLQTAPNVSEGESSGGIAQMYGHGITALRSNRYRKFFQEHGYVHSLLSVRPATMYVNGIDRTFLRQTREDFWQKELELIGQQAVKKGEVYADQATLHETFGYQDRYMEYRYAQSNVTGNFRNSTMYDWHFGRIFGSAPSLNETFVKCDPGLRPFQDQTDQLSTLWVMASHRIRARRLVSGSAAPRIF